MANVAPGHWRRRGLWTPAALRPKSAVVVPLVIPERQGPVYEGARADGVDWGPSPADFFPDLQADTGERRLMLAVLTDGIGAVLGPRGRHSAQNRREALRWLEHIDSGRMSFRFLCEGLGIEPTRVQQAILARVVR